MKSLLATSIRLLIIIYSAPLGLAIGLFHHFGYALVREEYVDWKKIDNREPNENGDSQFYSALWIISSIIYLAVWAWKNGLMSDI